MKQVVWHQIFSNYHNLHFQLNDKREILRIRQNVSAKYISVEISNEYDEVPLKVKKILLSNTSSFSNSVEMTLGGSSRFVVNPGKRVWTDSIPYEVSKGSDLFFSLDLENEINMLATSANLFSDYIVKSNVVVDGMNFIYGITSVSFDNVKNVKRIGFFGDSLTNQAYYSDFTWKYLSVNHPNLVTFNSGISGNRLLLRGTANSRWRDSFGMAGTDRFKADVLDYSPNIVVSMIGVNDLVHPGTGSPISELPTSNALIEGYKTIIGQTEKIGKTFIPLTVTPFYGTINHEKNSWSERKEEIRLVVNKWLLKQPNTIDLAKFVEDPNDNRKLNALIDRGDSLHFSKNGGDIIGKYLASRIEKYL